MANIIRHLFTDLPYLFFFVVFSTSGMVAIGVSTLAQPVCRYYSDKEEVVNRELILADLKVFHAQQQSLLENLDNPAILERLAISHLNYVPKGTDPDRQIDLPNLSPEFKDILKAIKQAKKVHKPTKTQALAISLAGNNTYRLLLFGFGGALVLISLTCFPKQAADFNS